MSNFCVVPEFAKDDGEAVSDVGYLSYLSSVLFKLGDLKKE